MTSAQQARRDARTALTAGHGLAAIVIVAEPSMIWQRASAPRASAIVIVKVSAGSAMASAAIVSGSAVLAAKSVNVGLGAL